jgi:hypothetical protein
MIANAEAMKGHRSIESFLWRKTATDKFADEFLPTTDCIFGRRSNPRSHRIYKVPSPGKIADFVADGETILEVRGSKHLTVFPGSVHPSGESIEFEEGFDGDPSLTDWAVLADAARKSATATLLFKNWIPGSRHSLALSASGFLRQLGWAEADAREVIRAVAKHAKDDEVFDRLECVNTTYAKTAGPILGRREVIDLLGEKAVAAIESWCESSQVRETISPTTPADSTNDSSDAFANAKRGQLIYRDDIDTWFKRDGQVFRAISYVQVQCEAKHFMQEQVGSAGFIGSTRSLS